MDEMSRAYPLDPPGTTYFNLLDNTPLPPYPFQHSILSHLIPSSFHAWSLEFSVPFTFSIVYYVIAHSANHFQSGKDLTKGTSIGARLLRNTVIFHNALLCVYSLATFSLMAPIVLDLFWQGYKAAGHDGLKLALCSMPTNNSLLGRWTYLFYLSKYYEVVDSVILFLKGKKIGNLQSYHHAGALICLWIAYRFQSQPVWVFCVFNSGVHTFMYAYYFCSALRLPFPKALKRNLTTLQIIQIASGTIITNLYFLQHLDPVKVHSLLVSSKVTSSLPAFVFASANKWDESRTTWQSVVSYILTPLSSSSSAIYLDPMSDSSRLMQLDTYAKARTEFSINQSSCLERRGAELALHVNTMYMLPLLALFANFFIRSYTRPALTKTRETTTKKSMSG